MFCIRILTSKSCIRWQLYSTVTLRHGEKKHYTNKVDAYSFAIVLWELIHNKLPFEGMSNLQAAYAAAFKVIAFFSDVIASKLDITCFLGSVSAVRVGFIL